jgi:hypothetical protein
MTPNRIAAQCRRHAKMHDVASNRQDETREVLRKAAECIDDQRREVHGLKAALLRQQTLASFRRWAAGR